MFDPIVTLGCVLKISPVWVSVGVVTEGEISLVDEEIELFFVVADGNPLVVDKKGNDVIEDGNVWVVKVGNFWAVVCVVSDDVMEGELWVDIIEDNFWVVSAEDEELVVVVEGNFWVDVVDDKSDVVVVGDVIDVIDCVVVNCELTVVGKNWVVVELCLVDSVFSDNVVKWALVVSDVQLPLVQRQFPLLSL